MQRLRHMPIAQVPRIDPAAIHRSVILFSIPDETSILLGREELLFSDLSIAVHVLPGSALEFHKLLNNVVFAGVAFIHARGKAVRLRVFSEVIETRVPCAGT